LQEDALLAFQIAFDLVENENQAFLLSARNLLAPPPNVHPEVHTDVSDVVGRDVQMTDQSSNVPNGSSEVDPAEVLQAERLSKIRGILSGEIPIKLTLQFLYSQNRFYLNSPHDIFLSF
jgi:26S proteasome regulatory subunit N2